MSFYSTYRFSSNSFPILYSFEYFSHREYTSNSEEPSETQESDSNTNTNRRVVPPENMDQRNQVPPNPPQTFNQRNQVLPNPPQTFNQPRQQPTPPQKKHIQHDTDVYVS